MGTSVDNRGVPGATSSDLANDLGTGEVASSVEAADVVLVTIGANDFGSTADAVHGQTCGDADDLACARSSLAALAHNLDVIVEHIRKLRGGEPTAILVTGYWNVYEDGDVADRHYTQGGQVESARLTLAVNEFSATERVRTAPPTSISGRPSVARTARATRPTSSPATGTTPTQRDTG